MSAEYKALKTEFVAWLRLGTREARVAAGEPPTVTAWAEAKGISRVQCQRWKNLPEIKRAVADHGITLFTVDEITAARQRLVTAALDGNVTAIKLMLEWAGVAGKGAGNSNNPPPPAPGAFADLTDEELALALAEDEDE